MILADAFELAKPNAKEIVPIATRRKANLRTHLERIIAKAGHEVWARTVIIRDVRVATRDCMQARKSRHERRGPQGAKNQTRRRRPPLLYGSNLILARDPSRCAD